MSTADRRVEILKQLCHDNDLELVHHGMGHYQIKGGAVLVNYYPYSKGCTMYIERAKEGVKGATAEMVIAAAKGEKNECA